MRQNLLGLSTESFVSKAADCIPGWERYRCDQIYTEIYKKGVKDLKDLASISKTTREKLMENFYVDFGQLKVRS